MSTSVIDTTTSKRAEHEFEQGQDMSNFGEIFWTPVDQSGSQIDKLRAPSM
jgi:hypothetical protein